MSYKKDLLRFAVKVGTKSVIGGNYLIGLKQLLYPISYWRLPIYNIVLKYIKTENQIRILDIGSPKLLSLYLAIQHEHIVYATDLQDKDIFNRYHRHYMDFKLNQYDRYIVEYQDARCLKYPDEYFDMVYSISVIEHIPDDGDKEAMREIRRVLKKDGIAIIEVPFAKTTLDEYLRNDIYDRKYCGEPVFYQRRYDKHTIMSRLVNESEMELQYMIITIERIPFEKYWSYIPKYIKIPILWLETIFSSINHYSIDIMRWEIDDNIKYKNRGMNVTLIMKKNEKV